MRAEERNRTLDRLRPFLADGLPAGSRVLLLVRDTGLDLRQPFTADRAALLAALDDVATGTAGGDRQRRELRRAMEQVRRSAGIAPALRAAEQYASLEQVDARLTVRHLEGVVDSLAGLPGRKALLYVGAGLPMYAGRVLFLAVDRHFEPGAGDDSGTLRSLDYDLSRTYRELTRRANAAGVTLYALDATGLGTAASVGVEQREWTEAVGLDAETTDNLTRALHQLAAETGGFAITGSNAPGAELVRLADDFGGAYSLGYAPPAGSDGKLHEIEVRTHRPGVRLRHREAYLRRSPEKRMEDAVAAALDLSLAANPLGLRLDTEPARSDAALPLRLAVPFDRLVLVPSGNLYVSELQLFVAARPAGRAGVPPIERAEVPVEIPAARAETVRGDYVLRLPLHLEPGSYRVAVGVRDVVTGLGGVVVTTVDVPTQGERAQILVARRPPREELPVAGAELLIRSGSVAVGESYTPAGPFAAGLVPTAAPLAGVDAARWPLPGTTSGP
jgi:VWFA-related protein